jgi:hypothetical protein
MVSLLRWSIVGIALLNLLTGISLGAAFGWHQWLKPKLARRRARQRSFERMLARSPIDNTSPIPEPASTLAAHGAHQT